MAKFPGDLARFSLALTLALLGSALATEVMAASPSLSLSPSAGVASATFSASYSNGGSHCNGAILEIHWGGQGGTLIGSGPTSGNSCSLTIGNLRPPGGTPPGTYTVWGVMRNKGSVQSSASHVYSVQAPAPSPPPQPTPRPTATAAPSSPPATAPATNPSVPARSGFSAAAGATPQVALAGNGRNGAAPTGGAPGGPPATSCTGAACSAGKASGPPAIVGAVAAFISRWPLPSLGLGVLVAALVTWWIYGTPMPGGRRRRVPVPVLEQAVDDPEVLDTTPAPGAEREIYSPPPGGEPRYRGRISPANAVPPGQKIPGPDDGLPPMAGPPPG